MLALIGVLLMVIFNNNMFCDIITSISLLHNNIVYFVFILFTLLIIVIGVYQLISAIRATIEPDLFPDINTEVKVKSNIFFGSIYYDWHDYTSYKTYFNKMTKEDYINDLISQIYINSHIVEDKYRHYNVGLRCILLGSAFLIIILVSKFIH